MSLVELYTSEGCSSCPPADEWVTSQKTNGGLFKAFVPIVFHVDYWNYLGWTDAFSKAEYSRRQRDYARLWKANSVFTPSVVVNGTKWSKWRSGEKIPTPTRSTPGDLTVTKKGNTFTVVQKGKLKGPTQVHIALLGENIVRKIGGGENSGKSLTHDFVVLDWQSNINKSGQRKNQFTMKPLSGYQPTAFAAWVQIPGQTQPLAVIGGRLLKK